MSCLMIPIRSNWMNGCLIRKLILFLYFRGRQRKEERLVFDEGGLIFIILYDFCVIYVKIQWQRIYSALNDIDLYYSSITWVFFFRRHKPLPSSWRHPLCLFQRPNSPDLYHAERIGQILLFLLLTVRKKGVRAYFCKR